MRPIAGTITDPAMDKYLRPPPTDKVASFWADLRQGWLDRRDPADMDEAEEAPIGAVHNERTLNIGRDRGDERRDVRVGPRDHRVGLDALITFLLEELSQAYDRLETIRMLTE